MTESHYRLATIPSTSNLVYLGKYPVVQVRNVFVLPGVPEIFKKSINVVRGVAAPENERSRRYTKFIYLNKSELQIADQINQLFKHYQNDDVKIGSYPNWVSNYYKTKLTIDCADESLLTEAVKMAERLFPAEAFVDSLIEDPVSLLPDSVYNAHLHISSLACKLGKRCPIFLIGAFCVN